MDPDGAFRPLHDHEMPQGHAILCAAFHWLRHRHIRQWTAPMPMSVYQAWQQHRWNYGLFVEGELAVVLSLVEGSLDEWQDGVDGATVLWLHALATATPGKAVGSVDMPCATPWTSPRRVLRTSTCFVQRATAFCPHSMHPWVLKRSSAPAPIM